MKITCGTGLLLTLFVANAVGQSTTLELGSLSATWFTKNSGSATDAEANAFQTKNRRGNAVEVPVNGMQCVRIVSQGRNHSMPHQAVQSGVEVVNLQPRAANVPCAQTLRQPADSILPERKLPQL